MNEAGAVLGQLTMSHTPDGLAKLAKTREALGLARAECLIGLETAHNLVIDFLWAQGDPQIYVIPPRVIKRCRGRYGSSQARTDQPDSRLIADGLRPDRARLPPWQPDGLIIRQLRAKVSLQRHLTRNLVGWTNRLRAVLWRDDPAALEVFGQLKSHITWQFMLAYPTPEAAAQLTDTAFEAFARDQGYDRHGQRLPSCFARLSQPYPQASSETVQVYQAEAQGLARLVLPLSEAKQATWREIQALLDPHPDHALFASLSGAGQFLAPALLAKFGDDRARFPSPASVQALAGHCPVTDQSGKRRIVRFRRACDRAFRWIVQQWALSSLKTSVWANAYWQPIRPQCAADNHAYRCLGNRWLAIAWKVWQTRQPNDQAYHLRQRALRAKPRP